MIAIQIRSPLVGLAAKESVEVLEPQPARPLLVRARGAVLKCGDVVVLAEPRRRESVFLEDLADRCVFRPDDGIVAGIARRQFADDAVSNRMMVAPGDQRRSRGRAQRRRVEFRVAQSSLGDAVHGRGRDRAAERTRHAVTLVIGHDQQHIRRALRRNDARWPPGLGIGGALLDHAAEFRRRRGELVARNRRRRAGLAQHAGDRLRRAGAAARLATSNRAATSVATTAFLVSRFMVSAPSFKSNWIGHRLA